MPGPAVGGQGKVRMSRGSQRMGRVGMSGCMLAAEVRDLFDWVAPHEGCEPTWLHEMSSKEERKRAFPNTDHSPSALNSACLLPFSDQSH